MQQRYPTGMESLDLILLKHVFGSAAQRANPTVREFIKARVRGDISVGIALFRIVNITADFAFPFFHRCLQSTPSPTLPSRRREILPAGWQRWGALLLLFQYFIVIESFDIILVLALLLNQKGEEIPEVFILVLLV